MERYYNTAVMKPTRLGVIINPISGRHGHRPGEADRRAALVRDVARRRSLDVRVHVTDGPGRARDLALTCIEEGCDVVAAMGGDGTVNEVGQALIGTSAALAVVPCGSGDGLALGLGIPRSREAALNAAIDGRTVRMDIGRVNDRVFLNVAGFGFDAAVGDVFSRGAVRGPRGYFSNAAQLVWRYRPLHYVIELEGYPTLEGPRFLVGFANAPQYGNGATLAPHADPHDGRLDVLIADADSPWRQIWRARRLYWRPLSPAGGLRRFQVRSATVSADNLLVHLDGEVWRVPSPARVSVDPGALAVRVPAGSRL
jgi:YegS/Rv2252/BmrU family lipid kinase